MNEKLLIIGECTAEIKKLLLQLFTAERVFNVFLLTTIRLFVLRRDKQKHKSN